MILRKLADAIREQNWFTVVLEVLIVVIGIFIGLQVDDWNEERLKDEQSLLFTERLISDLREEAFIYAYVEAYYEDVLQSAEATLRVLTNEVEMDDEAFLLNAFRASQYTWWARSQSTLDELISTGQLGLIRDTRLRSLAMTVYRSPVFGDIESEGLKSRYREAFRSLIPINVQRSLVKKCGDITVLTGDYESLDHVLNYECELDIAQSEIEAAVTTLKTESLLIPALRLRVATLDSRIAELRRDSDFIELLDYLGIPTSP